MSDVFESTPVGRRAALWLHVLLLVGVMGVSFVAFIPALDNGFVNWDDDKILVENYGYRGLGSQHIRWMFSAAVQGHYQPLTWLSYALDYRLWGELNPFGFHLTNLIWHALDAGLFYVLAVVLLRLAMPDRAGRGPMALCLGAALAAVFFGVHPLRVESVAWVTERRDVVSAFFWMGCVLCYIGYVRDKELGIFWYAAAVVCLGLSLLAKAWGITLPVVLLVLDFYPLRRLRWGRSGLFGFDARRAWVDKIPFALLAGWAAVIAAKVQSSGVIMKGLEEYGLSERVAQAFYGLVFYVGKTLLPTRLAPIYEIPIPMEPFSARFVAAGVVVVLVTGVLVVLARRRPAGLALWACYVIVVSPVLGLAQSGPQLVADRYAYLSCLPWALLAGSILFWVMTRSGRGSKVAARLAVATAVGLAGMAGSLTWKQCAVWRTSQSLWEHTLEMYPDSWNARVNLGVLHSVAGRYEQAVEQLEAGLALKSDLPVAYAALARAHLGLGHRAQAHEMAVTARREAKGQDLILRDVAGTLLNLGRVSEAIETYGEALESAPNDPSCHLNLALALQRKGDQEQALIHLLKVVQVIEPLGVVTAATVETTEYGRLYVQACFALGRIYQLQGDFAVAQSYADRLMALGVGGGR